MISLSGSYRTLLRESIWLYLGIAGFTSVVVLDAWFISRLGDEELLAVGLAGPLLIGCLNLLLALGTGITAAVAPLIGRKESAPAAMLVLTGVGLSGLIAVLIWVGLRPLLEWMHAAEATIDLLTPYFKIYCLGLPVMGFMTVWISLLRAGSWIRSSAIVLLVLCVVNAVCDPLLMFVLDLGLAGAAWATNAGALLAALIAWWFWSGHNRTIDQSGLNPWHSTLKTLVKVSVPAAGLRLLLPLGQVLVLRWLTEVSAGFAAAFGVGQRLDLWIMMAPLAVSSVAAPRIGQAWGRRSAEERLEWTRSAERLSVLYGFLALILVHIFASLLATLWSADPIVQEEVVLYLRIMSLAYIGQASFQVIQNSFYAIQRPGLAVRWALTQWLLWIGLAWVLSHQPGGLMWILLSWPLSMWMGALGARRNAVFSQN